MEVVINSTELYFFNQLNKVAFEWRCNVSVLEWFKSIENKHECTFTVFDIEQFYPSIKESVLLKALDFAKLHTKISKKDIDVIRHSRRSLLFMQGEAWVKKV